MNVGGVDISSAANRAAGPSRSGGLQSSSEGGSSFASAIEAARRNDDRTVLREAAQKLVTDAFIKPALAAMRESPFLSGPFAPGTGEKRFMPMLDEMMADRITQAANFSLVDAVMEHISNLAGYKPAANSNGVNTTGSSVDAGGSEVRHG